MRRFTKKKLCRGIFGILLLLIFYVKKPHIGKTYLSWALCPLGYVDPATQLREVIILPPVKPDRCVQTARMYKGTQTSICIKSAAVDKFVSGSILKDGAWEKNICNLVLKGMDIYKTAVFLDIGANIGIYTVLVAAASRKVVAVDAVMENLAYINHSLNISATSQYVRLLWNPVSDRVETLYPVTDYKYNQGNTRLVPGPLLSKDTTVVGPAVNTTTMLDVLEFVNSDTVIVKMDVEGFECKVLHPYLLEYHQCSSIFLPYIILEWMNIKVNLDSNCPDLMGLVDLLYSSGYEPFDLYTEKKIDRQKTNWKSFTDILWAHKEAVILL